MDGEAVTEHPACPTCGSTVHTAQTVTGGLVVLYPCTCWLHPDVGDDLSILYPEVYRHEESNPR